MTTRIRNQIFGLSEGTTGAVGVKASLSSAVVANASPSTIVLTYSKDLNESKVPSTSAFSVSGRTVSGVTISGSTVSITVTVGWGNGEVITISYTKPSSNMIEGLTGGPVLSLVNESVTNEVEFDSASMALFTRMEAADGVAPTEARKGAIDDCIVALKAASLWDTHFDVLTVLRGTGAASTKLNWIKDSANATAAGGTMTYTENVGYHNDGASYLNTNYNPSTYTNAKYTVNNAHFLVKLNGTWTGADNKGHGWDDGIGVTGMYIRDNYESFNDNYNSGFHTKTVGYNCNNRTGATTIGKYINGGYHAYPAFSSTGIPTSNMTIFRLTTGNTCDSAEVVELYSMGKGWASQAEFDTFRTIMDTYFAAL